MRFPGAAYVDIDQNGIPHIAPSGFPGDGLCRAFRCSRSGQKVAGFDQNDNVYEYVTGEWLPRGKSFGGRAVIYRGEELIVHRTIPGTGFRYVRPDGSIATAEETYAHPTEQVWEYTVLPNGWIVGQGGSGASYRDPHTLQIVSAGEDPLVILPGDGTRRLVQPGMCRFINAYLVSTRVDRIDLAWQEPGGCDARSLTLAEVLRLPVIEDVVPTPIPSPPPPETPPMPELPESLEADVRAERAKYPAVLTEDQPAKILNTVAWDHRDLGWGLSVKKHGNRVPSPQGIDVAYDILHHKPSNTLWGCFTDDLKATVNWGLEGHQDNPDRPWLAPIAPAGEQVPPSTPPPAPCNCAAEVEKLRGEVKALIEAIASDVKTDLDAIETRVEMAERKAFDAYGAAMEVKNRKLRVRGNTSRSFGHGHSVDLVVE